MMEHKAFIFDFDTFERELQPLLEEALVSGDTKGLIAFVNDNLGDLKDPYEGQPLEVDWEAMIETADAHQYGDFALTKYYDPLKDIGIGVEWENVQDLISSDPDLPESPILGRTVGPSKVPFDPGKLGSYFQSLDQVRQNHQCLLNLAKKGRPTDFDRPVQMLAEAENAKRGLYVTF
ncbi:MAG: hypothetical protein WCK86_16680 [Planctomycetia bacterium]